MIRRLSSLPRWSNASLRAPIMCAANGTYDRSESGARPRCLRIIENTTPKRPTSANRSTDNRNSTISVAYPKLVKSLWRPSKAHGDLYSRRNRQLAQTCSHVANPNHRFATSRWPRTCRPVHGKEIRRPTKVPHRRALVDVADPLPRHRRSPVLAVDTNVLVSPPMRTHNFMGLPRLARAPTGATGRFVHHLVDHL